MLARSFTALCVSTLLTAAWAHHCAPVSERAPSVARSTTSASDTQPPRQEPSSLTSAPPFAKTPPYFEEVIGRAHTLATQPASAPREIDLPTGLAEIDYDAYRDIRFRPERSLWRGSPGLFEVQFFHPGSIFDTAVLVSVVEHGQARPVPFSTELFSYEGLPGPPPATGLEFTGLRVHTPLNSESYRDEVVAFHGASYFRPLGRGNVYGLSARGLAVDLGEPGPEEFPCFTHFYLVRPGPHDQHMWILALLESRRVTGAYAFRMQPGDTTLIEVTAKLFLRDRVDALGLTPLTSMYLFGEDAPNRFGDFRPEVHDSDGLSMWSSTGEWLFRPLRNPKSTVLSSFRLDSPRGFGLVQRDRSFEHYQDLETRYQDRPSIWIEPVEGFGAGSVRLLEIASDTEGKDNIAVAWVPDSVERQELGVRYRLHVGSQVDDQASRGHVTASRIAQTPRGVRFLVDFAGGHLVDDSQVEAVISVSGSGARVVERHVEKNPFAGGLRASFELALEPGVAQVELRAFLRTPSDVLTETWSYLWQPNR
jgi:periplasmic glucans biosynthesis protein